MASVSERKPIPLAIRWSKVSMRRFVERARVLHPYDLSACD
jgi:hypothetical protein